MKTDQYKNVLRRFAFEHQAAEKTVAREEKAKVDLSNQLEALDEAIDITQRIAQTIQQQVHRQVASVVTQCLNAVFDEPYEFQIRFDRKRNKTEAVLQFFRDGMVLDDPLNEVGGGVLDVASLALRLSVILLSRPKLRRIIILDEPFKNVRGEQHKQRTRQMLLTLAKDLDFSFIINTDIPAYQLGTIVECE